MFRFAERASLVLVLALASLPAQAQSRAHAQTEAQIAAQIAAQSSTLSQAQAEMLAPIILRLRAEGFELREIRRTWLGRLLLVSSNGDRLREVVVNRRNGEVLRDRTFSEPSGDAPRMPMPSGGMDDGGSSMGGGMGGGGGDGGDGGSGDDGGMGGGMGSGMGGGGNMGGSMGGNAGTMGPGR